MAVAIRQRLRNRRKLQVKRRMQKNKDKLRLSVFKSLSHIYAQIIDDRQKKTLIAESTMSKEFKDTKKNGGNIAAAKWVGQALGKKAAEQGVKELCYDRNGFIFHGRVKALADAVRESGIKF